MDNKENRILEMKKMLLEKSDKLLNNKPLKGIYCVYSMYWKPKK